MMYKAKVAVCSDIHRIDLFQSERHVEFLNVKPWWYVKKPLGFKRLNVQYDADRQVTFRVGGRPRYSVSSFNTQSGYFMYLQV